MSKLPLSVAIIAHNEEDRIVATLESVKHIASEIIVIDSHSTDNTVEIAKDFGAKVFIEDWKGFAGQKNSLTQKCNQEWILYLDSDEVITEDLALEIENAIKKDEISGFYINRKTHYLGKLLNHAWQPNFRLRLVKKNKNPLWIGEVVHEELKIDGTTSKLLHHLEHYSYRDIEDHYLRTIRYAKLSAKSYYLKGKKPSVFKLLVNPLFSFTKLYFIKLGFLDGIAGLVAGISAFIYTFLKYAFLYEYYKDNVVFKENKVDDNK